MRGVGCPERLCHLRPRGLASHEWPGRNSALTLPRAGADVGIPRFPLTHASLSPRVLRGERAMRNEQLYGCGESTQKCSGKACGGQSWAALAVTLSLVVLNY